VAILKLMGCIPAKVSKPSDKQKNYNSDTEEVRNNVCTEQGFRGLEQWNTTLKSKVRMM
jgi:hypothetical protein